MRHYFMATALLLTLLALPAQAIDVSDLHELVGYTLLTITDVPGTFEGADFNKVVKLSNGMVFEFEEYNYSYSYMPAVAVFARKLDSKESGRTFIVYKLVIEDEIYDVSRLK